MKKYNVINNHDYYTYLNLTYPDKYPTPPNKMSEGEIDSVIKELKHNSQRKKKNKAQKKARKINRGKK